MLQHTKNNKIIMLVYLILILSDLKLIIILVKASFCLAYNLFSIKKKKNPSFLKESSRLTTMIILSWTLLWVVQKVEKVRRLPSSLFLTQYHQCVPII